MLNWFDVMDDPKRLQRLITLLAWRALRQSITQGRPISLPNVLRLYHRIASDLQSAQGDIATGRRLLEEQYRRQQPFNRRPVTIA